MSVKPSREKGDDTFTLIVLQSTHIITVPCLLHKGQKCSFKSITNNGNEKGDYSHYNKCSLEVLPFPTVPLENGRVGTKPFGTINPKTAKF